MTAQDIIVWKEEYSLGVKEIDEQHQKMFVIINDLYHAIQQSKDKEVMLATIDELINYADYHFSVEEKYFAEFKYEDTVAHIKTHDDYRKMIAGFVEEYKGGESLLSYKILDYLEDWWIGHILGTDKQYVECFRKNGVI